MLHVLLLCYQPWKAFLDFSSRFALPWMIEVFDPHEHTYKIEVLNFACLTTSYESVVLEASLFQTGKYNTLVFGTLCLSLCLLILPLLLLPPYLVVSSTLLPSYANKQRHSPTSSSSKHSNYVNLCIYKRRFEHFHASLLESVSMYQPCPNSFCFEAYHEAYHSLLHHQRTTQHIHDRQD